MSFRNLDSSAARRTQFGTLPKTHQTIPNSSLFLFDACRSDWSWRLLDAVSASFLGVHGHSRNLHLEPTLVYEGLRGPLQPVLYPKETRG